MCYEKRVFIDLHGASVKLSNLGGYREKVSNRFLNRSPFFQNMPSSAELPEGLYFSQAGYERLSDGSTKTFDLWITAGEGYAPKDKEDNGRVGLDGVGKVGCVSLKDEVGPITFSFLFVDPATGQPYQPSSEFAIFFFDITAPTKSLTSCVHYAHELSDMLYDIPTSVQVDQPNPTEDTCFVFTGTAAPAECGDDGDDDDEDDDGRRKLDEDDDSDDEDDDDDDGQKKVCLDQLRGCDRDQIVPFFTLLHFNAGTSTFDVTLRAGPQAGQEKFCFNGFLEGCPSPLCPDESESDTPTLIDFPTG